MTKEKKVITRKKVVLTVIVLALLGAVLIPQLWARYRAAEYLEEKYGDAVPLEAVKFGRTQANIFRGSYSVKAEYDGVEFEVYSGGDTFMELYHEKLYADLLRSGGMEETIGWMSVAMMDPFASASKMDRRDFRFVLSLNFKKTFGTKEAYAAAVRQVLDRLEEAELTCCDQIHTNGYIDDIYMQCSVYPMRDDLTDAEILSAVTVAP